MKIIKSGTPVKTVVGDVKGLVIGVCIRGFGQSHTIEYQVRYFANGDQKDCWVYDFEIEIDRPNNGAGFNRDRTKDNFNDEEPILLLDEKNR